MKKLFLTITAGFLITGTCVWMAGCKKEANNKVENAEIKANKQSEVDRITEQRIRSFRQQAKTNARVNENITMADALWYMEATLNYTFCRGSFGIIDPLADTAMVTLTETSAGMVEFNEVAGQYNNIAEQMQANVPLLAQNNRQYMLVDFMDMGSNNGIVTFRCIMLNGGIPDTTSGNTRVTAWTGFGPDDNWYYGEGKGRKKLNGTIDNLGKDASTVFTNVINTGNPFGAAQEDPIGNEHYFTDIDTIYIDKSAIQNNYVVPNQPINNILDYYIYYKDRAHNNNQPLTDSMILKYAPFNEMTFYWNGLKMIKSQYDQQFANQGKTFKCIIVNWRNRKTIYPLQVYQEIWHEVRLMYGIKHEGVIPD